MFLALLIAGYLKLTQPTPVAILTPVKPTVVATWSVPANYHLQGSSVQLQASNIQLQ